MFQYKRTIMTALTMFSSMWLN